MHFMLTHWTHIGPMNCVIIGLDNGLSTARYQAIIVSPWFHIVN